MLSPRPWDSDFFQIQVAQVNVPVLHAAQMVAIEAAAEADQLDVVYVFSESETPPEQAQASPHWTLVDTKVTFHKHLSPVLDLAPSPSVTPYSRTENHYPALLDLALAAGQHSRFRIDPRFGQERFTALYERWLERSLDGSFADYVLAARDARGVPTGFVTGRILGNRVEVGLIAVSSSARGQGLGRTLLDHLVVRAQREHGVTELHIPTQADNLGAMSFYHAYGMEEGQREWVWHYWRVTQA